MAGLQEAEAVLRSVWGYERFRPGQQEVVQSVLSGRDTLGLLPTGGGKSITFQAPTLTGDGLTIIVTPLISLMQDQIDNLRRRDIRAEGLHQGMSAARKALAVRRCELGQSQFLYISPERLMSDRFASDLRHLDPQLIVIDEAHCISQWGFDFRPSYLQLSGLRTLFPQVPILALTASATPRVQQDIVEKLRMRNVNIVRQSFARRNISFLIRHTRDKTGMMLRILRTTRGTAIVYVRSRKRAKEIAETLLREGVSADYYHAGLPPEEKEARQNAWQCDRVRVMVATNAFGMGIDKPDVRGVIHYDLPSSLEEYYQEAGRAGRDGLHSFAVLLAAKEDKGILTRRLTEAFPPKEFIRDVYQRVCVFQNIPMGGGRGRIMDFDLDRFCRQQQTQETMTANAIRILSRMGVWDYDDDPMGQGRVMMTCTKAELYHTELPPEGDRLLDALLRTYTGLFADYVPINESTLALRAAMTEQEVYETMLLLTRKGVLHYIPRRVSPSLCLNVERMESHHLIISREVYEFQRERMAERIEAMKRYAFGAEGRCRVSIMLDYFGEKGAPDCGSCDDCRARTKRPTAPTGLREAILEHDGLSLNALTDRLSYAPEAVINAVRELVDAGELEIVGTRLKKVQH